jgi:glycosyltransferase involved in cell wall biosynthesis
MQKDILVVADAQAWLRFWDGPIIPFEEATPAALSAFPTVVLAPEDPEYGKTCQTILHWKRDGLLGATRLVLGTYKGRHLWSPENDSLVERWVVHARSERQVLDSERLVFVPLCLTPPRKTFEDGDDGYVFMGGRKWRELGAGLQAMGRSGLPGRVISDFAPAGDFPNVAVRREKIPKPEYSAVMARARIVLVPLKQTAASHGHVDVITAILLGRPVLVTAGCSCDDYVQHGVNGLLVPDNSVEAWEAAIHEGFAKADAFAAAAREAAPLYRTPRYAEYIRAVARVAE